MDTQPLLSTGGMIYMGLYLFSLIGIGLAGRFARKENTMADFYLAGRGMGVFVLFLTLYATQYSGNTLIGFTSRAYREGFTALVTVTFMTVIVGAYLIFAPKLYRLSKEHNYITMGDFIQHRFQSTTLTVTITIIAIIALGNYILTNLKAIGFIIVAATGGQVSFAQGIIVLSLIMVIYETLGGMRSVAWTDMIQGVLLLFGVFFIFITIQSEYGGLVKMSEQIKNIRPDFWQPPDWGEKRLWLSTIIIVFFGISVYPHAIQRIYAARSATTLRRSLAVMAFLPLTTTVIALIVGIMGAAYGPLLKDAESDKILTVICSQIQQQSLFGRWLVTVLFAAVLAAIMSTADSVLLSISSMLTKDIYGQWFQTAASEASLVVRVPKG